MNALTIGIDGFNLALPRGTGVAAYGRTLTTTLRGGGHRVEGLFGLDTGSDPNLREVMFFDLLSREPVANKTRAQARRDTRRLLRDALRPRLTLRAVDVPLTDTVEKTGFADRLPTFDRLTSAALLFEVAFRHFSLYRRFLPVRMERPPSIMHWTYPVPVEVAGTRNIYTLHDLVPLRLPYTTLDAKGDYAAIARMCVARAAHICTVSEASRNDIVDVLKADPQKVTNTYQAAPPAPNALALSAEEDARMVEGILGLPPKGYFLFFGAIEPKKNVGRLIEAYLSLQTDTPLVIVGGAGWQNSGELRLLSGNAGPGVQRIIRFEFLPRELLVRVIRSARAVTFPSIYEGFGLPVLEAMQLGTPVLTSSVSALPEVTGDAAVLVDPYDVTSIAAGLGALDTDGELRTRLAAAGLARSAMFSEAAYLARLETMYAGIIASHGSR